KTRRREHAFIAQLGYFIAAPLAIGVRGADRLFGRKLVWRQRTGSQWKWLGWRRLFAGHVAGRNRTLFDAEDRLARCAIQDKEIAALRSRGDGRNRAAVAMHIEQNRRRGDVVIPEVVMNRLEMPDHLPGRGLQSDDGVRVEIVPG